MNRCFQCLHFGNTSCDPRAEALTSSGFRVCAKRPVWWLVSSGRPACAMFAPVTSSSIEVRNDFDLAELF